MKKLTQDQAEIIFSLFIAQNADKKISDLFPSEDIERQIKIGTLKIEKDHHNVWLLCGRTIRYHFGFFGKNGDFNTWETKQGSWYSFDIFKFISLEDKV